MRLALKTLSYGAVHVAVATSIAYMFTGDLTASLGLGLVEPLVQTLVFALHDRLWERPSNKNAAAGPSPGSLAAA